jgi:hypothetical protein
MLLRPEHTAGAKRWLGFAAMSIDLSMAILDIQIVASSLPDIAGGGKRIRTALPTYA